MNTTTRGFWMNAGRPRRSERRRLLLLFARHWSEHNVAAATQDGCFDPLPAGVVNPATSGVRAAPDHARPEALASPDGKSAVQSSARPGAFAPVLPNLTLHG